MRNGTDISRATELYIMALDNNPSLDEEAAPRQGRQPHSISAGTPCAMCGRTDASIGFKLDELLSSGYGEFAGFVPSDYVCAWCNASISNEMRYYSANAAWIDDAGNMGYANVAGNGEPEPSPDKPAKKKISAISSKKPKKPVLDRSKTMKRAEFLSWLFDLTAVGAPKRTITVSFNRLFFGGNGTQHLFRAPVAVIGAGTEKLLANNVDKHLVLNLGFARAYIARTNSLLSQNADIFGKGRKKPFKAIFESRQNDLRALKNDPNYRNDYLTKGTHGYSIHYAGMIDDIINNWPTLDIIDRCL